MSKNIEKLSFIRKYEIDNGLFYPRKAQALNDQVYLNILHHANCIDCDTYFEGMIKLMGTHPKSLKEVKEMIGITNISFQT